MNDNTDDPAVAQRANEAIAEATCIGCEDRGEGLKPMHIYIDGSGQCQCKRGPNLTERRMR